MTLVPNRPVGFDGVRIGRVRPEGHQDDAVIWGLAEVHAPLQHPHSLRRAHLLVRDDIPRAHPGRPGYQAPGTPQWQIYIERT